MKPAEAAAIRKQREADAKAADERLLGYLNDGRYVERVVPELIPREEDEVKALGNVRRLARAAERTPREKRGPKLDELREGLRRLIYVQRALALDPLERASLKPSQLVAMTHIDRSVLQAKMGNLTSRWAGTAMPREGER